MGWRLISAQPNKPFMSVRVPPPYHFSWKDLELYTEISERWTYAKSYLNVGQALPMGFHLSRGQLNFIRVLNPILGLTTESQKLFIKEVEENGQVIFPGLVKLIDALVEDRLHEIYTDFAKSFAAPQGLLSPADFKNLKVKASEPLIIPFRDNEIIMPGLPTSAGALIAFGLELWSRIKPPADQASFHRQFAAVASLTMDYRTHHFDPILNTENPHWSFEDIDFDAWTAKLQERLQSASITPSMLETKGNGSTTHVSVVDEAGLACAMTTSNGEGCGHIVPGWDIMANNFMGESDLHPQGFHTAEPGRALTSMMCPTILRTPRWHVCTGYGRQQSDPNRSSSSHL